jgi:Ca2+/Na+ antiporter
MRLGRMPLAILLYTICVLLVFMFKPAMMFNEKGEFKHFGYEDADISASLMNIEFVLITIAVFCYFVVIAVELAVS